MSKQAIFVHLRVRSEFSMTEGLAKAKHLAARAAELNMPALALADKGNLYGLVKFYDTCLSQGVKPLIACELQVHPAQKDLPDGNLLFLVRNATGYKNLLKLVSKAHTEAKSTETRVVREDWLGAHAEGLLVLSGGHQGTIGKLLANDRRGLAEQWLTCCKALWGDAFYLELQKLGLPSDQVQVTQTLALATQTHTPVVATHDVCFLDEDDFTAHETRVCICEGTTLSDENRSRRHSEEQYMKSPQQMAKLFADVPDALENTLEIAKKCNFTLPSDDYYLPHFSEQAPGREDENELLIKFSHEGLAERREGGYLNDDTAFSDYEKRLDFEIGVIREMGFAGYFLIVMDFVRWAKVQSIPVGPGRGSGAGSLVAYALGITDIDPLAYNLLFERFLNPERKSMPDLDIDFCIDGRDRVISYVAERYGKEALAQIITFGTMLAKGVVRDVARVQGKSLGLADRLAKMIPPGLDVTLQKAMEEENFRSFVKEDPEATEIIDMAFKLEGIVRHASKHASGVVLAPGQLSDYVPVTVEQEVVLTQFDKDDVERIGLVKFDFLGLRTLTIIDQTLQLVNAGKADDEKLSIDKISLQDEKVFESLRRAETSAVFQLESRGMRELMLSLRPEQFEDIVALVALYRPGPLNSGMADDFTKRRHGQAEISHLHPSLAPLLESTYGVILYQEQVMQIAQMLAGYSLGDADILRRAMGKKKPEEMEAQRSTFMAGAEQNDIKRAVARHIFDLMEKFAGYGFNRSHSVGYGLIAYQTAWLKAHYPAEFMAVTLSQEMREVEKIPPIINTCRSMGLEVLKPDICLSDYHFTVTGTTSLRYGLGAIRGVGKGVVQDIVTERQARPYDGLLDFCMRQYGKRTNKRAVEALIKAGALDSLPGVPVKEGIAHRAWLIATAEVAVRVAEQKAQNESEGLVDIFGESDDSEEDQAACLPSADQIPYLCEAELLTSEYEVLKRYASGHPVESYGQEIAAYGDACIGDLTPSDQIVTVGAWVAVIRKRRIRQGETMAFLTLEDMSGYMDVIVPADLFSKNQSWLAANDMLFATGKIEPDAYTGGVRMRASLIRSLAEARSHASAVWLTLPAEHCPQDEQLGTLVREIKQAIGNHPGTCPVKIRYLSKRGQAEIDLSEDWRVYPSDDCLNDLKRACGEHQVQCATL